MLPPQPSSSLRTVPFASRLSLMVSLKEDIKKGLCSVLGKGDILLIVPPFVTTRTPIMGPHILQAIARDQDYRADILYLNLVLASLIGVDLYESVSYGQPFRMLGERLFARSAYGLSPLGISPELCEDPAGSVFGNGREYPLEAFEYKYYQTAPFDLDTFYQVEARCHALIEEVAQAIASLDYKIVGCSANWEQNNCSIALINRLKDRRPGTVTLMGGSNCEDEMARGIASLSEAVDYIFSGESETVFAGFLEEFRAGKLPHRRIIEGQTLADLDRLPLPDYDDYFEQTDCFLTNNPPKGIAVGYETSRGCWYGRCFFCGMNGKRGRFRQKGVEKVVSEIGQINDRYPEQRILFVDKLMPPAYQEGWLPSLYERREAPPFTCEHRPDPDLRRLMNLRKAGVKLVKFGIESLSTGLLQLMNKGVTAADNILLLRNAAVSGIYVDWNLLWGFPGDQAEQYREILGRLPLLRHLCPPAVFRHVSLDRFSPYVEQSASFDIDNLRPWAVYQSVYPAWAEVDKLAYRFIGDYPAESRENPELIREIAGEVKNWKQNWKKSRLFMVPFAEYYVVYDSRNPEKARNHLLDFERAEAIMTCGRYDGSTYQQWAVEEKLGIVVDSRYIPLIVTSPELLLEFYTRNGC